jgi:Mg-chelatase subunit ChlD
MNRAILHTSILVALLAAGATAMPGDAAEKPAPKPAKTAAPRIDVVFVLDTTGSMSGLIAAAKEKIWSIANTMAIAKPTPQIRMGLVGYRDRRDAYVTKHTPLTDDLDAVYKDLMAFQAGGGGDTPESVNQALHEAVTKMTWSREPKVYRVIFLVGDCPPHMDYPDDVKYPVTCKTAAEAGIIINTIQCGSHAATVPIWQEIALKAEGAYFRVEQSGSAVLAGTPFDGRLAELSRELDKTRIYYGSAEAIRKQEARERVGDGIYKGASLAAQARRAVFNASEAGRFNFTGGKELVDDVASGRVKLADLKPEQLPERLQKMTPEQRKVHLEQNLARRRQLQEDVKKLAAQRQAHLLKQAKTKLRGSLDQQVFDTLREQAGKKGLDYGKAAAPAL